MIGLLRNKIENRKWHFDRVCALDIGVVLYMQPCALVIKDIKLQAAIHKDYFLGYLSTWPVHDNIRTEMRQELEGRSVHNNVIVRLTFVLGTLVFAFSKFGS